MYLELRNKVSEIESEARNVFSDLLTKGDFQVVDELDVQLGDYTDDYYEYRNDITGAVIDVHVIKVTSNGIEIIEAENSNKRYFIKYENLASITDKINLVEKMVELGNE